MRILLVNHTFDRTDGQGKVNANVAWHLLESGHSVSIVGSNVPSEIAYHPLAKVVNVLPMHSAPSRLLRHATFGWRTAKAIRILRPTHDLVIANGGMTFAPVDVNICHFVHRSWARSPYHPVRSDHGSGLSWRCYQYAYSQQAVAWERHAYHRARRVVAVSELVKRQLVDDVGVDRDKVCVIENGLDAAAGGDLAAARKQARNDLGVGPDQFVILFAGELRTPRKNFDVLVNALEMLSDKVLLVAAGEFRDGPYEQLIRERGLAHRVRLLGMRHDLNRIYPAADVFALLSHYDPFALVVAEALSHGVPVVTSESVGASGIVRRYGAGTVVDDQTDAGVVAEAIEELRNDASLRHRMGQRSLEAAAELAWPRVGERYQRLLQAVVDEAIETCGKPAASTLRNAS